MKFLADGPSHLSQKLAITLYKYVVRMATRSTPFGLFAGVALGKIADEPSRFVLSGNVKPACRLDMAFTAPLKRWVHTHTGIKKQITYSKNSSILAFDAHCRYIA